jgi:hypothetical protein
MSREFLINKLLAETAMTSVKILLLVLPGEVLSKQENTRQQLRQQQH